ncbi:hypothetical protein HPB47_012115 [Ixodes persulcatus]|uniref:Uncharacterized protein n=1 Tax=Ixodes persulcatus TaxID=34615 RepID=A0AC60NUE3_IXOPE|nr:hypothetical protein HPB47_012115 [Ixodes persulcatus]
MAVANLVGGAESGPVWSPAIFSREQTRAFIALISKRNVAELLGEGGPRPSLAKYDLRVRRGPKGFGASTNDTESSEHCRALHGSAERAAPTSVPFLAAQEPFGLGVRCVWSRSARLINEALQRCFRSTFRSFGNLTDDGATRGVRRRHFQPEKNAFPEDLAQVKLCWDQNASCFQGPVRRRRLATDAAKRGSPNKTTRRQHRHEEGQKKSSRACVDRASSRPKTQPYRKLHPVQRPSPRTQPFRSSLPERNHAGSVSIDDPKEAFVRNR